MNTVQLLPFSCRKSNYSSKMENAHIGYNLDNQLSNPANNFMAKNCLSGATNIIKHNDKVIIYLVAME